MPAMATLQIARFDALHDLTELSPAIHGLLLGHAQFFFCHELVMSLTTRLHWIYGS